MEEVDINHIDYKYDILKILQKGSSTYIGMDCIEGRLLIDIMRSDSVHEASEFYKWCNSLCDDIHSYHKSRKKSYKYITPYTIVIDEFNKAHLLDLQSRSNREYKEFIQSSKIRDRFSLPLEVQRKNKYLADYYSFAKTIQFILSQVQIEPNFSTKQIKQLKKIINTCIGLKKIKYQNMKELQREFVYEQSSRKGICLSVLFILLVLAAYLFLV